MQIRITTFIFLIVSLLLCGCNESGNKKNRKLWDTVEASEGDVPVMLLDSVANDLVSKNNDSLNRANLLKVAGYYFNQEEYVKYHELTNTAIARAYDAKDMPNLAKGYYYKADFFDVSYKKDSAFLYYFKARKIYHDVKQFEDEGRMTLYIGDIYYQNSDYSAAELQGVEALKLFVGKNDRLNYESYLLIALALKEQDRYAESLRYFEKALGMIDKMAADGYNANKAQLSKASCYNNIGLVYEKQQEFKNAIVQYKKALATHSIKDRKPNLYAMLLNNYAYALMKQPESTALKHDSEIKRMLFEAYNLRDSLKIEDGIVSSKIRIGEYFLAKKDTANALVYLKSGYQLSVAQNSGYDILKVLLLLSGAEPNNADYYAAEYAKENSKMLKNERSKRNKFARIEFESEQLQQENNQLVKKNYRLILSLVSGTVFLLILFYIYWLRAQNKKLLLNKKLDEVNRQVNTLLAEFHQKVSQTKAEEQRRISRDLHDNIINKIFSLKFKIAIPGMDLNAIKDTIEDELGYLQSEIRKVAHDLHNNSSQDIDIVAIIKDVIAKNNIGDTTKIDLYIDNCIDWMLYTNEVKINIIYIIQEIIQNILKHSNAKKASFAFFSNDGSLLVRVIDNGVGFDTTAKNTGIGLKNIADRIALINGTIKITSQKGKGTTIEFSM